MGTHVWEFRLSIQVCVWVYRLAIISSSSAFSIHIQVEFRFWYIQLADKYKALTFSIHIQGIQVYIQVWVYRLACISKPVYPNLNA